LNTNVNVDDNKSRLLSTANKNGKNKIAYRIFYPKSRRDGLGWLGVDGNVR